MNEILENTEIENKENIEILENSENLNINLENENTENIEQSNEKIETETQQEAQQEAQQKAQQKKRRGRPRKTEQTQETTQDNKSEFFNDLTAQENINKQFEPLNIETENDASITPIDLKQTLLFLDNLICNTLKHVLHKKIEPMTEEEADFLASLAPPDLYLLKPSKTTFFLALAGYYVLKLF